MVETTTSGGLVLPDQILPPNLFVLPINGPIAYPTLLAPLLISNPRHVAMIEEAINRQRLIGILATRDGEPAEETKLSDLYDVGVVAKIIKRLRMPDGSVNLLIHCMRRFRAKRAFSENPYIVVETEYLEDIVEKSNEMDALTRSVISYVKKLSEVNPFFTDEMRLAMINAPGPGTVADLVAFALSLPKTDAQDFLETLSVKSRFEKLLVHLRREQNVADLQKKINDEVNHKLTKLQREFFLKEQLKTIKRELGYEEDGKEKSSRTFRERIESAGMPDEVRKIALSELEKFETISEQSPEYNIARSYLETLVSLPWSNETIDDLDLDHAREVLDADHFGLEKVKERIIEFLAVRKLRKDVKGSIICLVGPPGVGKTSIGKSIAKTLGRSFFRFSLGGMRDEAEIKGHRRTYVGAMPGKLIQGMKRAGTINPVLMLDEVDKLGQSFQGDPASALLEVLDPEQNSSFLDHYLDVPYDLSKVLFVLTANSTATIPGPLLDRMEVIEIPGYTLEEKERIATQYVIPRELEKNGIKPSQLRIEKAALRRMMIDYAREPGLRSLQQLVSRICRKAAAKIVTRETKKSERHSAIVVTEESLLSWLGPQRFYNEVVERITAPGVVVGLAWTAMGGDILFIEATDFPGAGNLKLTGQMGEVMTESAAIAWSYVKKKLAQDKKYDRKYFKSHDFHLHIPAGAIPKDGPSAGVTMATALYSLISGRKIKPRLAMTGELSLVGKVLAVGGVKEKVLAARRAGVTTVILPKHNEKDMFEIPEYAKKGMTFHFVSTVDEVFDLALVRSGEFKRKPERRVLRTKPAPVRRRLVVGSRAGRRSRSQLR
ncbi:MAG: endopeptidase La [Oligoflexia bacterium]|nr:endopeptidase La [Oligoflexia bacterium]